MADRLDVLVRSVLAPSGGLSPRLCRRTVQADAYVSRELPTQNQSTSRDSLPVYISVLAFLLDLHESTTTGSLRSYSRI